MTPWSARRRLTLAASAALAVTVLAGCSGSSSSSAAPASANSSSAASGVTLTIWHNSGDSKAILNLYKAYEAATGNKLDIVDLPTDTYPTAVQTKWATGDRPDILEYLPSPQDMAQLDMADNMVDLSKLSFVAAEGKLSSVAGSISGVTYGAILGPIATFGLYYNKKALSAAGVSVPTSDTQLTADCAALTKAGTPLFVGGGSEFPPGMIAGFTYMADFNADDKWGQGVKNGTVKVSDPNGPLVAGWTLLAKLRDTKCLNTDAGTATVSDAVKAVYSGKAAMTVLPSDFIDQFYAAGSNAATVDAAVGFAPISATDSAAAYSPGSYGTYFVPKTKDATKQQAAVDFINWVTTKGYQNYVNEANIVPTMSTATAPKLSGMYATMATMLAAPNTQVAFNNSVPGFGPFGTISVKVLVGQDTPQKAGTDFQTIVDQAIAASK